MKNLLICVSGLTPQVITETLYCLSVQKNIRIDELYVITTNKGRDVILGEDEDKKLPAFKGELKKMCAMYKLQMPKFEYNDTHIIVAKDQSIELSDIRNDKHNRLFPNKLCEFMNEKTKDKTDVLYCSISGGRKSMSVDMAFALSLFGKENDKLLHVLTHEKNEFKGFYPKNKKEEKDLELSELPYVKLRSIIGTLTKSKVFGKMKYTDIVEFAQEELKLAFTDKLILDIGKNEITLGENESFRLEPAAMKLYKFILDAKNNGEEYVTVENILNYCPHKFTKKGIVEKVTKIKKVFEVNITDIDLIGKFIIQGPNVFGSSNYGILADKLKFKIKQ
jgi:CRISPR-associated protein (TIGR02584 family)